MENKITSWWTKAYTWDISFCMSDCANKDCDRSHASKMYQDMIVDRDYIHTECDFSKHCADYIPGNRRVQDETDGRQD